MYIKCFYICCMKTSDALQMASFASPQEQLVLTVLHTASGLLSKHRMLLKPHGITPEQFNILRILRGQKGKPIALRDISSRMIDKNSNTSRLIDKLLTKGLVKRESCPADRRRVDIVLTATGQEITEALKNIMDREMSSLEDVWSNEDAQEAIEVLDRWNGQQH